MLEHHPIDTYIFLNVDTLQRKCLSTNITRLNDINQLHFSFRFYYFRVINNDIIVENVFDNSENNKISFSYI